MNNFLKLKNLFDIMKVDYEIISSNEIRLKCPLDLISNLNFNLSKSQIDIIHDEDTTVFSDECWISIYYDEENFLNWLVVAPR